MKELDHTSRREFLKALGIYAGTSLFAASLPWFKVFGSENLNDSVTAGHKVNIGMIGIGSRGRLLLLYLKNNPGVDIVGVCDNYPPNLEKALELTEGKAQGFEDYRRLLELKNLDAVVIATPLHEHAHITIDALDAGKHTFCEKAMARTTDDCLNMYNKQKATGKILQIGHQRMFNIKYIQGIERIKNGEIGPVTQIRAYWHRNNNWRRKVPRPELERKINWRLYKEYSCGLMTELAAHQIQVANWILGEYPDSVSGAGSINYWNDGREVHDNVALVYTYPSGTQLIYDSLTSNKHYGFEEQILGSKGTYELEIGKMYVEDIPPPPGILQLINNIENSIFETIPLGGASWVPETAVKDKGTYIIDEKLKDDGTDIQMEAFVNSVREGKPIPELLDEGYNASIASLLGYHAIEDRAVVNWPEHLRIV